jgi:hydroxyacylglutathione hydrolase
MQVIRFFVPNSYDNYNHLLICPQSKSAAVVDPFDADQVTDLVDKLGIKLEAILLTHEHGDHTRGCQALSQQFAIPVYGPGQISQVSNPVIEGDQINIGSQVVTTWETPGHTMLHVSYLGTDQDGMPFLICGDTVFNAGVGNTRSGSTETLYLTIERLKRDLDGQTRLYPAHDYILNNLSFAKDREPGNGEIDHWITKCQAQDSDSRVVTQWRDELSFNPFLRLNQPELRTQLEKDTNHHFTGDMEVFSRLRDLRDQW